MRSDKLLKYEDCLSSDFWGYECSSGWVDLLIPPLEFILEYNKNTEDKILVDQIKEKFGTLRFYTTSTTKELEDLIDIAEKLSETTCETCGKDGKLYTKGWCSVRCDEHKPNK